MARQRGFTIIMARIVVLQEHYWETHRILVETSTERAETQFYMLFELY